MFRLVVLDMDGTLVDSMSGIMETLNRIFSKVGLGPYGWDRDIKRFFGRPFEEWAEVLLKEGGKYSEENLKNVTESMWNLYENKGIDKTVLTKNADVLLDGLKARNIQMAVATNMRRNLCKAMFEKFGLGKYIQTLMTVSDVREGKPGPEMMERIIKKAGVKKEETLMVGDSISDVEFAGNSGVKVAVLDQPWNGSLKSDYRISDLKEIIGIVTG